MARARSNCRERDLVHFCLGHGPAVEEQPAVADDADHRRVAEPERRCQLLLMAHA